MSAGFVPALNYVNTRLRVKFDGSCLRQEKLTFTPKNVPNIYIFYKINLWLNIQDADFVLELLNWVKNADPVKWKYSGYGIGFDDFSLSDGGVFGKNVIKFGANIGSLVHVNNKKEDISILGKCPTYWFRWYYVVCRESIFYKL